MENSVINVYGYVRVSTEGQAKQGYSLSEQREEIRKYCKDNKFKLVKMFGDEGISGAKADEAEMSIEREGLVDMLSSLKSDGIKYIVVLNTSRLWRSDFVKILIHRELKKYGVDVKAIDRPMYSIYTQNPNEILVNGVFELLDVYERMEISLKLKRGRMEKHLDRPIFNVMATLCHEMIHYYCQIHGLREVSQNGRYHNKVFKREAENRGLIISYAKYIGYSVTEPSEGFKEVIKKYGLEKPIDLNRDGERHILVGTGGGSNGADGKGNIEVKKKSSTRKYVCPACGASFRATKDINVLHMDCGVQFVKEVKQ